MGAFLNALSEVQPDGTQAFADGSIAIKSPLGRWRILDWGPSPQHPDRWCDAANFCRKANGIADVGLPAVAPAQQRFHSHSMAKLKIDGKALAEAVKKLRRLRLEDVGGRKERPAETVASVLKRGWNDDSPELIDYILRHGVKYYLEAAALPDQEGAQHGG